MTSNSFKEIMVATHLHQKNGKKSPAIEHFNELENNWLSIYGIGKLEFYSYIYSQCNSHEDFDNWLLMLKGKDSIATSDILFDNYINRSERQTEETVEYSILNNQDIAHWNKYGYLRISGLVPLYHCDAITQFICDHQNIDLSEPGTWYPSNPDWHGLMLQVYQQPDMVAIRSHPKVKQLFAELYQTNNIIANTDKVSYNPPETADWKFRHYHLHWDLDASKPAEYYIQGLIYLNDVPENRGALKVVPGFHHKFDNYITQFASAHEAQESIQNHPDAIYVPGKKGDIVVWLQSLPHAASTNHSDLPRFVQYLSFTKL